jgi:hypothetical protein
VIIAGGSGDSVQCDSGYLVVTVVVEAWMTPVVRDSGNSGGRIFSGFFGARKKLKDSSIDSKFHGESIGAIFKAETQRIQKLRGNCGFSHFF